MLQWLRSWSAAGVFATIAALILASYQVQGVKMPDWLFNITVAVLIAGLFLSVGIWLLTRVLIPLAQFLRSVHFRSPVVHRGRPDPNQWLLDIAQNDLHNPPLVWVAGSAYGSLTGPELYIEFAIEFRNCSIYEWMVRGADGVITIGEKELAGTWDVRIANNFAPRTQSLSPYLRFLLTPEQAKFIRELPREHNRLFFDLRKVQVKFARDNIETPVGISLGQVSFEIRER